MWAIEAKTFGDDPNYFRMYGLTEAESRRMHKEMANSGECPYVRSCDPAGEPEQPESDARITAWSKEIEDGIGEGQST